MDAFCYGIYASGAKQLSMATCFPSLVKYEKENGSLIMGALHSRRGIILQNRKINSKTILAFWIPSIHFVFKSFCKKCYLLCTLSFPMYVLFMITLVLHYKFFLLIYDSFL